MRRCLVIVAGALFATTVLVAGQFISRTRLTGVFVPAAIYQLLPERATAWNPGVAGGIPTRTTQCGATIQASTYGNGVADARGGIQTAIDNCPAGQVVQLSAGTFKILSGANRVNLNKGVTLRGAGPTQTLLTVPDGQGQPAVIIGPTQFLQNNQTWVYGGSTAIVANVAKETNSVTVADPTGFAIGQLVLLDQLTDTATTLWSATRSPLGDPSRGWFSRNNRPVAQMLEIASIVGSVVSFVSPIHIAYTTAFSPELTRFVETTVANAGLEDLKLHGGEGGDGGGNIFMQLCKNCWVKNVESEYTNGSSIHVYHSYHCTVRDSYFHETKDPNPGGGGYGIDISHASADNLIENNISWNFNKVMVMRASGGGNVIAYNYLEDGWISYATSFVEVGLNASHMTTPHMELFEGNQSFNFDGDNTWGNAVDISVFRNHLTGKRRSITPLALTDADERRAIGLMEGHWWYTFAGNVLGTLGQSPAPNTAFTYQQIALPWLSDPVPMWKMGYNPPNRDAVDAQVLATMIRDGNYDYVTNTVKWDGTVQPLPNSFYLVARPAFFGSLRWPWVQPTGAPILTDLPARSRFDGGVNIGIPIISRDVPVFVSDNSSDATKANDSDYGKDANHEWRAFRTPTVGSPVTIAYDLSKVPVSQRTSVNVSWSNNATFPWDHTHNAGVGYNLPADYTIEANPAAGGGSAPTANWTSLITVTGNVYHARAHRVDLTGYNWVRLRATASDGSSGNADIGFNLDVMQGSASQMIPIFGDSITALSLHPGGLVSALITATDPTLYPAIVAAGQGGLTAADCNAPLCDGWFALFPAATYMGLALGTNDINTSGFDQTAIDAFDTALRGVIQRAFAAGKTVIIPSIPWARTVGIQANGAAANAKIDAMFVTWPQLLRGPDLWTWFLTHQSEIDTVDDLHPTETGKASIRTLWAAKLINLGIL